MSRILIAGHPQSGYQEVESLLNACGMNSPNPSRREGFLPSEINSTLCKAHWDFSYNGLESDEQIEQIEAGSVWHGMAMDLMLGNLEQEFWGWADPQSLFLLNFWRDLDPKMSFILLYDKPQSVLTRIDTENATSLTHDELKRRIGNWRAYNDALLHFFHRNPKRCLLVNSQQVRQSVSSYLQKMSVRIDAPWSKQMEYMLESESIGGDTYDDEFVSIEEMVDEKSSQFLQRETMSSREENSLMTYLSDSIIQQHPTSLQLYEELQSVADFPLEEESECIYSPVDAWLAMTTQQEKLRKKSQLAVGQLKQIEDLSQYLNKMQELVNDKASELRDANSKTDYLELSLEKTQAIVSTLESTNSELKQNSQLLLDQLHHVQEELEKIHAKATSDEAVGNKIKQENESLLSQLHQLQDELKTAKSAEDAAVTNEMEQENELLLNQLHQVQEELERYHQENYRLKNPVYYGAGERIRQQLTYKLGATMIQHSRSIAGWVSLPWALIQVSRRHHKEIPVRKALKLPPINSYQDAPVAARYRNHLSYRLGYAFLGNVRNPVGWLRMPWALSKEVRDFRRRQVEQNSKATRNS